MRPEMTPTEYVSALYESVLGRPADPGGLEHWVASLESTGDATAVLRGLMASQEYATRTGATSAETCRRLAGAALDRLGRRPCVVDVGAQALEGEEHVYAPLQAMTSVDIIGFDPLAERLEQRALSEAAGGGDLTLVPHALGDGGRHTLHVNNDDATSSLFPFDGELTSRLNHLATLETINTIEVETRRIDDVLPDGPVDLLKLDIQGAELMVLEHADRTLARTAVIHCEVEFAPIYAGQPLYGDVARRLRACGFELLDLVTQARYHYLGTETAAPERLVWGDAVFLRETDRAEELAAQALVVAALYGKASTAEHLLQRAG